MTFTPLRTSVLFRRIRRSRLVHEYVRPIYARRLIRAWWAKGRPAPPPHDVKLAAILYLADLIGAKDVGPFVEIRCDLMLIVSPGSQDAYRRNQSCC